MTVKTVHILASHRERTRVLQSCSFRPSRIIDAVLAPEPYRESHIILVTKYFLRNLLLTALFILVGCQSKPGPDLDGQLGEVQQPSDEAEEVVEEATVESIPEGNNAEVPASATIRVHLGQAPLTLDPTSVAPLDTAGTDIVTNIFSGLTQINPVTRRVEPALARDWEVSDDGLTWTVFLRDDIHWASVAADGSIEQSRPIVAADVVAAVERGCRNDVLTIQVERLFVIDGCRQINRLPPEQITPEIIEQTLRARILNNTVIEFILVEDYGAFSVLMASSVMYPIPADRIAAHGDNWTLPENILTSGQYTLAPPEGNAQYTLRRNPQMPAAGNVGTVNVVVGDASNALDQVASGNLDFAVVPDQVAIDNPSEVQKIALPVTAFIAINHESPVINQAELKAAFSRGLDRSAIVAEFETANSQLAIPAYVASPPGSVSASLYRDVTTNFDAGAAQQAINDAGLNGCLGLPDRTFAVDNSEQSIGLVQTFVNNWSRNLGCREEAFQLEALTQREILVILKRPPVGVEQPRPGLAMFYWQGEVQDAQHWYADIFGCRDPFFRDSYLNSLRECSEADELLLRMYREDDPDVRASLMPQVEQAFFGVQSGEFPVIPVLHYARGVVVSNRLDTNLLEGGPLQFSYWQVIQ